VSRQETRGVRHRRQNVNSDQVGVGRAEWKDAAFAALLREHGINADAIPPRVWTKLFARRLSPSEAADRAEIYYHNIRPAGLLWRKTKR